MGKEIKAGIRIDLTGNVLPQSKRYTDAINRFARTGRHDLNALRSSGDRVSNMFNGMGTRLAGLAAGVGVAGVVRQVSEMERRMTRLGIAANASDEVIKALKNDIYAVATSPDIRVDPTQIIGAIEQILELTGNFEFAKAQIRNLGIGLQATGADAAAMGAYFAELEKAGIRTPEAVAAAIDTMNLQGKEGAFTLKEFAALGPRLFSSYAAVGRSGALAAREIGATVQVIRGATGSSEQATTSFEALMRVFSDANKIQKLNKAGIKVFDANELKRGHQVLRPINELMADIVRKTKGRATVIQDLLGDSESARAFGNLIKEFNKTGDTKSLEKFMSVLGDGTATLNDSKRAANDSAAAIDELYAVLRKFADDSLTAPIHFIADELKALMNDYREFKTLAGQTIDAVMAPRSNRGTSIKPKPMEADVSVDATVTDAKPAIPRWRGRGGYSPDSVKAATKSLAPGVQNLGRDSQAVAPAAKPADGKVTVEIVSPVPIKVKSMTANSGEINVKNTRAGAHFQ